MMMRIMMTMRIKMVRMMLNFLYPVLVFFLAKSRSTSRKNSKVLQKVHLSC